jgi:hypothetical protein
VRQRWKRKEYYLDCCFRLEQRNDKTEGGRASVGRVGRSFRREPLKNSKSRWRFLELRWSGTTLLDTIGQRKSLTPLLEPGEGVLRWRWGRVELHGRGF